MALTDEVDARARPAGLYQLEEESSARATSALLRERRSGPGERRWSSAEPRWAAASRCGALAASDSRAEKERDRHEGGARNPRIDLTVLADIVNIELPDYTRRFSGACL